MKMPSVADLISRREIVQTGLAAAGLAASSLTARAQNWPTRNVTIIVPYAAGGIADLLARLSGQVLNEKFGRPFIIDNRPTGGGIVGASTAFNAAPDGYTLLLSPPGPIVTVPYMQKVGYDPDRFVPIVIVAHFPLLLAISSTLKASTFPELIAHAKANPGKLNYASGGMGSVTHLLTALLVRRTGIQMVHVPYQGSAPATTALIANQIDMFFGTPSELLPQVSSGRIKILATSGSERLRTLPDVPAINETIPEFRLSAWNGLLAAPGTPQHVVDQVAETIVGALARKETINRLTSLGVFPGGASSSQFGRIIAEDKEFYKEALNAAGISPK